MIKIKRAYDPFSPDDGRRILVDGLWPRGIKKAGAHIDEWMKDIAPSAELRKWYAHDPAKWEEFRKKYKSELKTKPELVKKLKSEAAKGTVTLVFAARDAEHANAAVLKEILK
ncbi:MAG: DUF488 family protein [Nitrospiraceae bacterium]|nr:DUF488 family protein [Nitrospiraceae bacterium]